MTNLEMTQTKFQIPENKLDRFIDRINALNKKAERFDQAPISFEVVGTGVHEVKAQAHEYWKPDEYWKYVEVEITGQSPKLDGWQFAGTIDHTGVMNLIKTFPYLDEDVTIPTEYRDAEPTCDHCQTIRRRSKTYLLHKEGEWRQVGRQCLKDFLGHQSPEQIAMWLELNIQFSIEWGEPNVSETIRYYRLEYFLALTAAVIEENGWVSKGKAQEYGKSPTIAYVLHQMFPPQDFTKEEIIEVTDAHRELAEATILWAQNVLPEENMSDYEYNLHAIAHEDNSGMFHIKNAGLAASMIMCFKRFAGLLQEAKVSTSEYQGEVKVRSDWVLTVNQILDFESEVNFGGGYKFVTKHLHKFTDENENVFVWWSSSARLEEGETYELKGTVKEHSEYNGIKQTVLTRCKVKDESKCQQIKG